MATAIPKNSVWSAMGYPPPKGRCNHKTSLMSPACPCLRFMLHPVKAATSFECDGCNHHASFHSLENPAEDAIIARWEEQEAASKASKALVAVQRQGTYRAGGITGVSKKRKRIAEKPADEGVAMPGMFEIVDVTDEVEEVEGGAEKHLMTPTEHVIAVTAGARKPRAARGRKT